MFRAISIIGFVITFLGIGICCVAFPCCKECRWTPLAILKRAVRIFAMLPLEQKLNPLGIIRKLVYLLALLCFLILVITSFFPVLILKEPIHGYWLILHATFAPVFAICLAVLALMWAENLRFSKNDWPYLQKICFWLIIILAIPLILSIVMSMFPFLGTYWQELLLNIHRYTALAFAVIVIVHTYLIIRTRMEQQ
jgi:hypothetical protein